MALNGSGIRDTARVLGVSQTTVIETLKKKTRVESRQRSSVSHLRADPNDCAVVSS